MTVRPELLMQLVRATLNRDWEQGAAATQAIATEAIAQGKGQLGAGMKAALSQAKRAGMDDESRAFMTMLPQGREKDSDLVEMRPAEVGLADMQLDDATLMLLRSVVAEHEGAVTLREHGFEPVSRLLFAGPPGCGKTLAAEALAYELERPFVVVRIDGLIDSHLGDTARNLRRIFEFLKKAPACVVCLDEFDAICAARNLGGSSDASGEIKRTTNALLQMLDTFKSDSILIATTNFDTQLDQAVWRRFDEAAVFTRPTPDQAWLFAAAEMMRQAAIGPGDSHRDLWIGLIGQFSYADIARVVRRAAKRMVMGGCDMNAAMRDAVAHETRRPEFTRMAQDL